MAVQKTTGGKSLQGGSRSNSRNSATGSDGVMAVGMMAGAIGLGITLLDKEKAEAAALEAEFTVSAPTGDVAVASAPHEGDTAATDKPENGPEMPSDLQTASIPGSHIPTTSESDQLELDSAQPAATDAVGMEGNGKAEARVEDDSKPAREKEAETVVHEDHPSGPSSADSVGGFTASPLVVETSVVDDVADLIGGEDGAVNGVVDKVGDLLGEDGLVGEVVDTVGGLLDGEDGLVSSVVDTVENLLGEDGIVSGVVGTVGDLLDGEDSLVGNVVDTVGNLLGEDGVVSGVVDTVGGLLDGEDSLVSSVVDTVGNLLGEDGVVNGVVDTAGDLLVGEDSVVSKVVDTVGDLLGGEDSLVGGVVDTAGDLLGGEGGVVSEVVTTASDLLVGEGGIVGEVVDTVGDLVGGEESVVSKVVGAAGGLLGGVGGLLGGGVAAQETEADATSVASPAAADESDIVTTALNVISSPLDEGDGALDGLVGLIGVIVPTITFIGQPDLSTDDGYDPGTSHGSILHGLI